MADSLRPRPHEEGAGEEDSNDEVDSDKAHKEGQHIINSVGNFSVIVRIALSESDVPYEGKGLDQAKQ